MRFLVAFLLVCLVYLAGWWSCWAALPAVVLAVGMVFWLDSEPPMKRIVFTLPRAGESTIAIVTVEVKSLRIRCADDAFKAVRRAVTNWVSETDEGKELWQQSCKDMNIGDLATHLDSADSLKPFLKKEGIEMLDIEIPDTSGVHACNYTFDSHLVDEEELPEELHDKIGNGT